MHINAREDGFTLIELMVATAITLLVLSTVLSTFKNALAVNETVMKVADSNQNMRAATNLFVRDLLQAGRGVLTGGIPIPSGLGATAINRPSPPGLAYTFNNVTATTLPAVTTGAGLGPTIGGTTTDMITLLMTDAVLPKLELSPAGTGGGVATLGVDGTSLTVGTDMTWITGNAADLVPKIKAGDLVYFSNSTGAAIQAVTRVDGATVFFEDDDWFNFNQAGAAAGSITQILANPLTEARRLTMLTYYVDAVTVPASPRLVRQQNHFGAQALAGAVEDLHLSFDLVDSVTNPTEVRSLPYTLNQVTYTANQIRKVNLHVGVRSDHASGPRHEYAHSQLSTVISLRNLAFVDRYQQTVEQAAAAGQ